MRRRLLLVALALAAASSLAAKPHAVAPPGPPSDIRNVWFSDYGGYAITVAPGDSHQFALIEFTSSLWPFSPRPAQGIDVSWTVEPLQGVTIDRSGRLTIPPDVSDGSLFTVYANLNHGARIISTNVYVYRAGSNPLYGAGWVERATIPCDGSADIPVADFERINELFFDVDGTFKLTWHPFEAYVDYWGPYTIDTDRHRLRMGISHGNYVPDDMRGDGTYAIANSGPIIVTESGTKLQPVQLRLKGMWLGSKRTPPATPQCGMVFDGRYVVP